MISVCVPYWQRQASLDRMFTTYATQYPHLDLQFSICDDGSPTLARSSKFAFSRLPIMTYLPQKQRALNPCVPINRAVTASTGDVVVLTNAEIMHPAPVLYDMLGALRGTTTT